MSKTIDDLAREQGVTPMGDADDVARRIVGTVPDTIEDVRREIERLGDNPSSEAVQAALEDLLGPVGEDARRVRTLFALTDSRPKESEW